MTATARTPLTALTTLSVRVEPADRARAAAAASTLATLPLRFAATEADAEIVVVSGAAGWGERVRHAAQAGARAVVVTDPEPDASALALAQDPPAAPIILAEAWASNPVLRAVSDAWAEPLGRATLLDVRSTEPLDGRSPRSVLVAQLRAVAALGVEVAALTVVAATPSAALAVGRSATGSRIVLSAARSAAATATLDILSVGREATVRIEVPDGTTARPGHATLTTRDGAVELPTRWETAYRAAWGIAHERALAGGGGDDVAGFVRAVELLEGGAGV